MIRLDRSVSLGHRLPGIVLGLFLMGLSVSALADEPPTQEPSTPSPVIVKVIHAPAPQAMAPVLTDAVRVYRDPATGELGPPPAAQRGLSQRLQNAVSRSNAGLSSRMLPNGAIALDLQGRFMTLAMARRGADGALDLECADHPGEAIQWLNTEPGVSAGAEEVRDDR